MGSTAERGRGGGGSAQVFDFYLTLLDLTRGCSGPALLCGYCCVWSCYSRVVPSEKIILCLIALSLS